MKIIKNFSGFNFIYAISIVLALVCLYPLHLLLAAGPSDFMQTTFSPTVFSKTEIQSDEIFYATVKSKGVCIKDVPKPSEANRFSFRYVAKNATTGEQQILNPSYQITVAPFPQKVGETYETSNDVPLQFPSGSQTGSYSIIEETTKVEMKDPTLGWQNAPEPTKPSAPVKPDEPTMPTAPTKPSEPPKPAEPSAPSAPTKPAKPSAPMDANQSSGSPEMGGGTGMDSGKPAKPAKPAEPEKPAEPAKPAEPSRPSEPPKPAEPSAPTEPSKPSQTRELGIVRYYAEKSTTGANSATAPTSAPSSSDAVTPVAPKSAAPEESKTQTPTVQKTMPAACLGACTSSQTCPAGTTNRGTSGCSTVSVPYKCGFLNLRTCYRSVPQFCCVQNPPVIPTLTGITVSAPSVINGDSLKGAITLTSAAPANGFAVQLTIAPSGAPLSIPANVTVKPGESSATFSIGSKTVSYPVSATITAKANTVSKTAQIVVNPTPKPNIAQLNISPTSVFGGSSATGTVTLDIAAPAGGQAVQLIANSNVLVGFRSNVTVKAGETSATFAVQTKPVGSPVAATIAAKANNSQKTTTFMVNPVPPFTVSAFSISPSVVFSGETAVGTISIGGGLPTSDQVIQLSGNPADSRLTVPATVTVKAGATSGTFSISAGWVGAAINSTITASLYNSQKTANLIINPMPAYCPYSCRVSKCGDGEIAVQSSCGPATTRCYSCGSWWRSKTCCDPVYSVCCKAKSK